MAELYGADISEWQGTVDWDAYNANANFVLIRASFGTLRKDNQFDRNQAEARRVRRDAGPLGIGYYYFAYPTLLSPSESAAFFIDNLGPLEEGEVLVQDLEGNIGSDPVSWTLGFMQSVEARTGVKPWLYVNQTIMNGHNWAPVIGNGNKLWLADYDGNQAGPGVATPWPSGIRCRQWTDVDVVHGIPAKVDGDTFYGTFDDWYADGYHVPQPVPVVTIPITSPPAVPAVPIAVTPVAPTVPPDPVAQPEFVETFKPFPDGPEDVLLKSDTAAIDVTGNHSPIHLDASRPYGTAGPFKSSGTFTDGGSEYYRGTSGSWYGVPAVDVASSSAVKPPVAPTTGFNLWNILKDPVGWLIRLLTRKPV